MLVLANLPISAPIPAPMAIPKTGMKNSSPNRNPQNIPQVAPADRMVVGVHVIAAVHVAVNDCVQA